SRGGSAAVHAELRVGQRLRIGEPRNLFPLSTEPAPRLLFAGGIGITPLLAMAERLAGDGADFQLHYCAHSAERAAFVDYLGHCAFADRVHCHFDHGDSARRADPRVLLAASPRDTQLYLCGPAGFMRWIESAARDLGWEEHRLHREHFTAAPQEAAADTPFELELASSGALIRVAAGQTALAALREAGVELPASCEQGICGTCLTRVLDGEPDHRDLYLSDEEQAANDCFTPCCSRARSPRLLLDL
ncbi:PDR/VanB family oxidoreductase, partial [Pseudomonas paraeruginosa]